MALSTNHRGWRRGLAAGYAHGYESGVYLGRCEAVIQQAALQRAPGGLWDVSVLFVTSGKGFPYAPIDQAIIESLRPLVRELIIGHMPGDPVQLGGPAPDIDTLVALHRPDLMLVLDGLNMPLPLVDRVRASDVRTAIWLTDDPYYSDYTIPMAPHYDFMFTLEKNCLPYYRNNGCSQAHYLPFAVQPQLFRPVPAPLSQRKEIAFIGSGYWNRIAIFDRIAPYLARRQVGITGIWWDRLKQFKLLARSIRLNTWMGPAETAQAYSGAKTVINMHRAHDDTTYNNNSRRIEAVSPNPRTFEISGCGALQVTDMREDLVQFYTPDAEIVTYASPEELVAKLDYYLKHEEERRRIALNGLLRTLRDHTYENRLSQLLCTVFGEGVQAAT
ncbi:glycosyltransferase [Paenibacillus athensensis]|uniref:Spore maturation protein cgeB n=1 Tax=Paenibacillus athensensis TaxID=1967502 RepID=A0A4Y8PXA6_9BACL|nr:glycosyltransferase [Paenibacillus athensensis]MCD1258077.1 glycosyltransferase [Paenibacillus athensensis]